MLLERILSASNASIFRNIELSSMKAIFHPATQQEIREAIQYAKDQGISITAKGGGSSLSGAATGGGEDKIIISTNQLRKILEVNQEQKYAWVEPGLTPVDLNKLLSQRNIPLRYLVSPSSQNVATLGGMLSTDAGGSDAWIQGTTRDNLLAVEIMDYHGNQILVTNGDNQVSCTNKELEQQLNEAEFSLNDIAASHGTLGFVTKMQVMLKPIKSHTLFWATLHFEDLNACGVSIQEMINQQIPFTYAEAFVELNKQEMTLEVDPPMMIVELPVTHKAELDTLGNVTPVNTDRFDTLKKIRKVSSTIIPKSGRNFPLFEGYGIAVNQLPKLEDIVNELNEVLTSNGITPFFKIGHAPSKWYDDDQPRYGLIMHSREVRPEEKTGKDFVQIIDALIDFCNDHGVTPKPEHKWPYLQNKKGTRLIELASLFENKFNPFVLTHKTKDLAAFV